MRLWEDPGRTEDLQEKGLIAERETLREEGLIAEQETLREDGRRAERETLREDRLPGRDAEARVGRRPEHTFGEIRS